MKDHKIEEILRETYVEELKTLLDAEIDSYLQRKHDAHLAMLYSTGKPKP